jgi:hypothetical protein
LGTFSKIWYFEVPFWYFFLAVWYYGLKKSWQPWCAGGALTLGETACAERVKGYLHILSLCFALCRRRQATTDCTSSKFVSDVERDIEQQSFHC